MTSQFKMGGHVAALAAYDNSKLNGNLVQIVNCSIGVAQANIPSVVSASHQHAYNGSDFKKLHFNKFPQSEIVDNIDSTFLPTSIDAPNLLEDDAMHESCGLSS